MAESPITNTDGPLGISIKLDGTALADDIAVVSVRVEKALNSIPSAVVVIQDGLIAENDFPMLDSEDTKPGAEIEIAAFYGPNEEQTLFKGIITATRLRINEGMVGLLELRCRDKAIALADIRRTAAFAAFTDAEVMRKIIEDAGLNADIAATNGSVTDIVQYDVADWDFLRMLADRNGMVLAVDDATIIATAPDLSACASLTLTLGVDIVDFDARIEATGLEKTVSVSSWNPKDQSVITRSSDAVDTGVWGNSHLNDLTSVTGNRTRSMTTPQALGNYSLSEIAVARSSRVVPAAVQGRCSYVGSALAGPGDMIELTGVGRRLSGIALMSGVIHMLEEGRWTTTAILGLPQAWHGDNIGVAGTPVSALTSPVLGLHVAKVLAISDDSANDAMIKVGLPLIASEPAEIWARYAHSPASTGAGDRFLPEIDDEVVVGFLSADPAAPVVLGALKNGQKVRPADTAS